MYITPRELRRDPRGITLEAVSDIDLFGIIQEACDLVDAYTDNEFFYQEKREQHNFAGDTYEFHTYLGPIRVMKGYRVITGVAASRDIFFDVPAANTDIIVDPTDVPTDFGNVKINRDLDSGDASPLFLTGNLVAILERFGQLKLEILYTSGYDDGTVQADGFTMPYPSWLKTATKIIARDLIEETNLARRGLANLNEVRVQDAIYRRPPMHGAKGATIPHLVIPDRARIILEKQWSAWM